MLLNSYSLPELVDLALRVPEAGAVNFNILHTVLLTLIAEAKLQDVRPWCHIENPTVAQAALTQAKMRGASRRSASAENFGGEGAARFARPALASSSYTSESESSESEPEQPPAVAKTDDTKPLDAEGKQADKSLPTADAEAALESQSPDEAVEAQLPEEAHEADIEVVEQVATDVEPQTSPALEDAAQEATAVDYDKDATAADDQDAIAADQDATAADDQDAIAADQDATDADDQDATAAVEDESTKQKVVDDSGAVEESAVEGRDEIVEEKGGVTEDTPAESDAKTKSHRKKKAASDSWRLTNLTNRVDAAEEGLFQLATIVDALSDRMQTAETRRRSKAEAGGPPKSEEMEALDERLNEIDEILRQFEEDHEKQLEVERKLKIMLEEFEKIKALGAEMADMKAELALKANKIEVEEALATKGDLSMVLNKVDRSEFETAIEELGEAIGLLAIKFQKQNEEWDSRNGDVWKAIESKMSAERFEKNRIRVEERLKAIMFGLRKIQDIISELLYPDSSAVTKCIACARPAAMAGGECLGSGDSPIPKASAFSSGSPGPTSKSYGEAPYDFHDKQSLILCGVPALQRDARSSSSTVSSTPYSEKSRYSPSSQSPSEASGSQRPQFSMRAVHFQKGSSPASGSSQVPSLPSLEDKTHRLITSGDQNKSTKKQRKLIPRLSNKVKQLKPTIVFTNMLLAEKEKQEQELALKRGEGGAFQVVHEEQDRDDLASRTGSPLGNRLNSVVDPVRNAFSFAPVRLMQNPLRRDIVLSRHAVSQYSPNMNLPRAAPVSETTADKSQPSLGSVSESAARNEEDNKGE